MVEDKDRGAMAYPKKRSLNRLIYKLPVILWRLGFGPYLSHPSRGARKMMVVTTTGRISGLPRHTMVSCIDFDHKHYAVSGWWLRSDWVKNFQRDPFVTVQAGGRIYSAQARRVEDYEEFRETAQALVNSGGDSHFGAWLENLEIEPCLDDLLDKRDLVHIVCFDPVDQEGPPALLADLIWIWAVVLSLVLGLLFFFW